MSQRHFHYEAAVEDYLKSIGRPYIVVDDAKRAIFSGAQIKSFDFLVYSTGPTHWLVDVKGRKLVRTGSRSRGHLENWTTREDIVGLQQWTRVFGEGFGGLLVFAYWLTQPDPAGPSGRGEAAADGQPAGLGRVHPFGGRRYLLAAMPVDCYAQNLKDRSRRWGTVSVPAGTFRRNLRALDDFL